MSGDSIQFKHSDHPSIWMNEHTINVKLNHTTWGVLIATLKHILFNKCPYQYHT